MPITIVQTLSEAEWRRFVDEHPQGNIFHTPEMFQVLARAKGHHPTLWAAVGNGGRVLALLLPVQITLMDGLLCRFTTRAVSYGGVLCAPGIEGKEALAMLLRAYKREMKGSVLFTELRNLSDLSGVQPVLRENNFFCEGHLNFLVDIGLPVDKVWRNIHKSARKKIRKAFNKNLVEIEEVHDRSQIATCYAIFQDTYAEAHIPLADRSVFEAAFDILYPKGMVKFLLGWVEDTCVAASAALLYRDMIYGWYRGFSRAYSAYLPNDLMVWYILKWGAGNGYHVFDFGGAGKPDEDYGPRRFKAKFGGTLVNYGRNICIHHPHLLRFSQWGYQLYRRFL
jgi:serine/alanine adding enzyme